MKKRIPILIVALLIAAAAIYAIRGMNKPPENRLTISGNIELNEVNIAFKTSGRLIERTVNEGDDVKKGQIVARIDRDQLQAQRQRETAGLAGTEYVTRQKPDGYTLLLHGSAPLFARLFMKQLTYDPADLRPIAALAEWARRETDGDLPPCGACKPTMTAGLGDVPRPTIPPLRRWQRSV